MDTSAITAAILAARHTDLVAQAIARAALSADDSPEFVIGLVGDLVKIIHTAGHCSTEVDMVLDMFTAFPETINGPAGHITMIRINPDEEITQDDIEQVFTDLTEGTNKADRLWTYKAALGPIPMHTVVLEGSGFVPRVLAVMNGTADDARSLRDRLAARERV